MVRQAIFIGSAALLAVMVLACSRREETWHSFTAEAGEPNLVVVFKRGTSPRAAAEALDRFSSVPRGAGQADLRPGIRSLVKTDVHGHEAYSLAFRSDSTPEQLAAVRGLAQHEPTVLVVFEGVLASAIPPDRLPNEGG